MLYEAIISLSFYRTFAKGVACWQGTLTPLDTWSRPIWDLHMVHLLRPIFFPNLSLFFRTMIFEHLSVLSRFCFLCILMQLIIQILIINLNANLQQHTCFLWLPFSELSTIIYLVLQYLHSLAHSIVWYNIRIYYYIRHLSNNREQQK